MSRLFFLSLPAGLVRALLAECCGRAFQIILGLFLPDLPLLVCDLVGLVLGILFVETVWIVTRYHLGFRHDS